MSRGRGSGAIPFLFAPQNIMPCPGAPLPSFSRSVKLGVWEDNMKMGLEEVGYGSMNWIELAQDRDRWRSLVNALMKLQVP
jgi:hypothetical protein